MRLRTRRSVALLTGVVIALFATFGVLAAGTSTAEKVLVGEDIVIPAGTTITHDLYAFGNTITVDGTVDGDLVAAGARVLITGSVTGDVLAAASEVRLGGTVGGDVRAAAAQVTILGPVSEDVAVVASSVQMGAEGSVGQDLLFAATQVLLDGNVGGGISGTASDYTRHGTVGGTEDVSLASRLDQPAADRTAALALDALRQYAVVFLLGLAFLRFAPGLFRMSAEQVRKQPFASAGVGVLGILGYLATLIILFLLMLVVVLLFGELAFGGFVAIDVIGTVLAVLSLTFGLLVFSAFIADAIVGLAIGRLIAVSDTSRWADVIRLAIGSALVVLVTSFPDVGGIVKLLVILVALGAALTAFRDWRRRPPVALPVSPAAA